MSRETPASMPRGFGTADQPADEALLSVVAHGFSRARRVSFVVLVAAPFALAAIYWRLAAEPSAGAAFGLVFGGLVPGMILKSLVRNVFELALGLRLRGIGLDDKVIGALKSTAFTVPRLNTYEWVIEVFEANGVVVERSEQLSSLLAVQAGGAAVQLILGDDRLLFKRKNGPGLRLFLFGFGLLCIVAPASLLAWNVGWHSDIGGQAVEWEAFATAGASLLFGFAVLVFAHSQSEASVDPDWVRLLVKRSPLWFNHSEEIPTASVADVCVETSRVKETSSHAVVVRGDDRTLTFARFGNIGEADQLLSVVRRRIVQAQPADGLLSRVRTP